MSEANIDQYNIVISELKDITSVNLPVRDKYIRLKEVLERICRNLTKNEALQFSSLFSRIVYISQKYNLPKELEWQLQNIRIKNSFLLKDNQNIVSQNQYEKAVLDISDLISIVYLDRVGEGVDLKAYKNNSTFSAFYDKIRVQVINIDSIKSEVTAYADSENREIIFKYGVENTNDKFNSTIDRLWIGAQLNLINCRADDERIFTPQYIVLEPDYLIDASAMAECFQNYGKSHLHYFRRKFEPNVNSHYILLGNLANYFLDELVYSVNPNAVDFQNVFLKAFTLFPFEFTSCNDIKYKEDFLDFMSRAGTQFENIKRVVSNDFALNGINPDNCTLEPSFYCEKFGFQGRLDLFQNFGENDEKAKIVELKSGGLPFPKDNPAKISINHEVQTIVYRLIIQSVFDKLPRDIEPFILYSAAENKGENMRYSAAYRNIEKEIINMRNLIVATEHDLYSGDTDTVAKIFHDVVNINSYGPVPQFFIDKLKEIEDLLNGLTEIEKKYFFRFISFISRELYIQKAGEADYSSHLGISGLWNTEFEERNASYELVSDLKIEDIKESETDMKILFRAEYGCEFVNFRVGDICVLYPRDNESDSVLTNQILKGTIAEINSENILVRFRYRQKNKSYLYKYDSWVIEHDSLDHTYNFMFKSMYAFIKSPLRKKSLLLGVEKPQSDYNGNIFSHDSQQEKQQYVINRAIAAKDYFLIVGPPGTGKTSIFARNLIKHYYTHSSQNILLLAYTNRAVDELCESITSAFGCDSSDCTHYIRIGSELSCASPYKHRLLQSLSKNVKSRAELRKIIDNTRIFVGTLASINGKPELFDLKKFDIAIIDEASQILEPQIIGLLTRFGKFIMIGDHKQLSTITLQEQAKSEVSDGLLINIALEDCRESLFERLYRVCYKNNWQDSFDTLTYQGRMHNYIANIVNKYFYDNDLKPVSEWQNKPLNLLIKDENDFYQKIIFDNRVVFLSVSNNRANFTNDKINEEEADAVVELAKSIIILYKHNNLLFDSNGTLGIITPYRNQIALIRHKLRETGITELENIMIDTVERFQGSQRDIIIVSFCMNRNYQLDFFCNLNREKSVDRKLNVTLTRARQQLFLIGNEYILRQNRIYSNILDELDIISI